MPDITITVPAGEVSNTLVVAARAALTNRVNTQAEKDAIAAMPAASVARAYLMAMLKDLYVYQRALVAQQGAQAAVETERAAANTSAGGIV